MSSSIYYLIIFLFFTFSSSFAQSSKVHKVDDKISWKTFAANPQRTSFIKVNLKQNRPDIVLKKPVIGEHVVANGIAYFLQEIDLIVAFDIVKQKELWEMNLGFPASKLALDDNLILYAAGERNILAVDVAKQIKIWKTHTDPSQITNITVAEDILYRSGNSFKAYDLKTGAEIWAFEPPRDKNNELLFDIPTIYNQIAYIGGYNSGLYAVDLRTGKEVWCVQKQVTGYPVYDADKVFIIQNQSLYAHDAATGKELWHYKSVQKGIKVGIAHKNLYFTTLSQHNDFVSITALDIDTGVMKWEKRLEGIGSAMAVTNNAVIVGVSEYRSLFDITGKIYALDPNTGNEFWQITLNDTLVLSEIIAINNAVIFRATALPDLEKGGFEDPIDYLYILK